jgi:hypothetical protein
MNAASTPPMYGFTNSYWGIGVEWNGGSGNGHYELVANNSIKNVSSGIAVDTSENSAADYILISGNILTNCNGNGIYLGDNPSTSFNIVKFNTVIGSATGIAILDSSCVDNTVYGNAFRGCTINFSNNGVGTITSTP